MSESDQARGDESESDSGPGGLALASTFVLGGLEPPRIVVHYEDDTWSFTCGTATADEHFLTLHAKHVFRQFGYDLFHLRGLPPGSVATRDERGDEWVI